MAYRPLRDAPKNSVLISAIGASFLLENLANYLFSGRPMKPSVYTAATLVGMLPGAIAYNFFSANFLSGYGIWLGVAMTAIKKVCSPPLIGFLIGILAVLLEIPIPDFLNRTFRYVGSLTTPLSLIFIGIEMSRIPLSSIEFDRDMLWSILGRFLVCPLCVLCLVPFIPISPLSAQVFTMQAAMPAMTQMAIVAKSYGADSGYAATLSLVTVLAGVVVIPAYMFLVSTVLP